MEIYILRHGQAEDRSLGRRDADRKLTPKGVLDVGATLKLANIEPQQIYTSGLRRADESAALVDRPVIVTRNLEPSADPAALWNELRSSSHDRVLLVGHEPHLSQLVLFLLGATIAIKIRKGALIRIDAERRDSPQGILQWMITPRIAKRA